MTAKAKRTKSGGRTKGTPNRVSQPVRVLASAYSEQAIWTLAGLMCDSASDKVRMDAAAALLDRAHGRPATETRVVSLPSGTLTERAIAALEAAATGQVSPGEAAQLVGAIAAVAKLIETDDLVRRMEKMEAHFGKN